MSDSGKFKYVGLSQIAEGRTMLFCECDLIAREKKKEDPSGSGSGPCSLGAV